VAKVKSLVFQARSSLIETRKAREIPCHEIREQLATLTGGALRRGPLRRHIRACEGCAEFRDEVMRQRKALAAVLPVVPTVGLKSSLFASIGVGGGGGGAAIGGGAAATGGIASIASSGAAVKVATMLVVAGVAVGGEFVLDQRSPERQAEAAGGQSGNTQAWPAPAAGTGPGARELIHSSRPLHTGAGGPAARTVASKPPAASGPGGRRLVHVPSARRGAQQRDSRRQGGPVKGGPDGRHPTSTAVPGPSPTSTAPPANTPAATSTPGDDENSDSRGHHGGHRGWQQGRGHDHHEQDIGGTHVPGGRSDHQSPPPRDQGEESGGGDRGHGGDNGDKGDDEGAHHGDGRRRGHDRVVALVSSAPPPAS
jgi:hypothetical protein